MIVLGAKTDYSFLRGFGTPKQWRQRAEEIGVSALGIADYCSTWGHAPFRDAFKGSKVKLLYGVQVPVVGFLDKDPRHSLVTLYARDNLSELYRAMSLAHEQTYYRPRLTWRNVLELKSCFVVVNNLLTTHVRAANSLDKSYCYVGDNGSLSNTQESVDLNRVVDYSPRFPAPDDREGFKIFQSISGMQRIGEVDQEGIFHMMRAGELTRLFDDADYLSELSANADTIAKSASADIPVARLLPYDNITDKRGALIRMAMDGAKRLGILKVTESGGIWADGYLDRLDHELDVICEKKFEDYFFFVADICEWANERMLVGPGRGSAGGSLLCFLLGITHVDPLRFGTLFDRFIDVTRSDLPDIDIDFPDIRREEVFQYMREKWGEDCFAHLGTLTELGGKSALNAVARATDVPFDASREIGKWTEGAGQGKVIPPKWIFEHVPEVQPILEKWPSLRLSTLLDMREHMDDEDMQHVSHHGIHASGVVVTDQPVGNFGTVDREGVLSMDMRTAEKQGFVKIDVLGLKTLSVIQETCDMAGIDPRSLRQLDWNDISVFDTIFNKDAVTGVFQFDGNAVRGLMKQIKVDKFEDLCALTSLARPGPLIGGAAGSWVKSRNGEEPRESIHPALEATYGVICYQEQMMAICRDCAGFDVPGVNGMRRAVAKKDPVKLAGYRPQFVEGMTAFFSKRHVEIAGGTHPDLEAASKEKAEELWEEICEFGSYAFNRSHAVAYSMLSFMTAWLKTKYPLQFATAQLKYAADEDDTKHLLRELIEEGFGYVPFDAEKSAASWSVVEGKLYGGFDSIRGIGLKTAERHVALREAKGHPAWLEELTEAQRAKVTLGVVPWHSLSYFHDKFKGLYADPGGFKSATTPKGVRPPVYRLRDLPEAKGEYAFLGRIVSKKHIDGNEPARVEKRGGKKFTRDTHFINLTIEDDTGEVGATINRFKAKDFEWLLTEDLSGRDFLFRGNVIEEGRKWLFLDKVLELK